MVHLSDCRKDDLRNQRTTVLGNALVPKKWATRGSGSMPGRGAHGAASESPYQNNAACVGGGTLSYGAQAWRYMPQDFRMRSTYGAPPGSSLEDWPISYDDLEPFYEKAELEIGVSGDYSGTPFHGPRRRDLPMPPLPPNREFGILEPAAGGWACTRFIFPWHATAFLTTAAALACAAAGVWGLPAKWMPRTARRIP